MADPAHPTHVLHVGAPKCGSSALQTALSEAPDLVAADGARYRYAALGADGVVRSGAELRTAARATPERHLASLSGVVLAQWPAAVADRARAGFAALRAEGVIPVLSSEEWLWSRTWGFDVLDLLDGPVAARVVAYVRPPVEAINSAWWQWGAWDEAPLERFVENQVWSWQYARLLEAWTGDERIPWVDVRLLSGDIGADFGRLLGFGGLSAPTANSGPGAAVLRLMQRHRELRPGPHDSGIDFALERMLGPSGPKPWVLSPALVTHIIAATAADAAALQALLAPEDAARMAADPRWWESAAYADRPLEPAGPQPADGDEADALAAIAELLRRDKRVRRQLPTGLRRAWRSARGARPRRP